MILIYLTGGSITGTVLSLALWSLPFVVSSIIHQRVSGETFGVFVSAALLIAGIIMAL